jgi:hypothetical protein
MFIDRFEKLYSKIAFDKLLIVDEAHNFYNKLSEELSANYKYKLGLSATPVFGNDESKSKTLLDWFGGIAQNLPIEKAIGKHLVNYYYRPIFVMATENDECKFNKATQKMVSATDSKTGKIINQDKFNKAYRERLRAISMADEKSQEQFDELVNELDLYALINQSIEQSGALGTVGTVVSVYDIKQDEQGMTLDVSEAKTRVDVVDFDWIFPLSWNNKEITECAFGSVEYIQGQKCIVCSTSRNNDDPR